MPGRGRYRAISLSYTSVIVCCYNPEMGEALIATSAEDSTVRLWDLRDGSTRATASTRSGGSGSSSSSSSPRVATCVCRCFGGEAVSSVVFGAGSADRLYCSAGGKVRVQLLSSLNATRAASLRHEDTAVKNTAEAHLQLGLTVATEAIHAQRFPATVPFPSRVLRCGYCLCGRNGRVPILCDHHLILPPPSVL